MDTQVLSSPISRHERDRLAGLLASLPPASGWAVRHRHGPLLCALGLIDAPDAAYAHAAHRRFSDPSQTRRRALALLDELDRDARSERYARRRGHGA